MSDQEFEGIGGAINSIGGKGKDRPPTEQRSAPPAKKKK